MTWPEALVWVAVGVVLPSVPRMLRMFFRRRSDYLKISGKERRQMWAKDGTL